MRKLIDIEPDELIKFDESSKVPKCLSGNVLIYSFIYIIILLILSFI